jgi:hypothetical protein
LETSAEELHDEDLWKESRTPFHGDAECDCPDKRGAAYTRVRLEAGAEENGGVNLSYSLILRKFLGYSQVALFIDFSFLELVIGSFLWVDAPFRLWHGAEN